MGTLKETNFLRAFRQTPLGELTALSSLPCCRERACYAIPRNPSPLSAFERATLLMHTTLTTGYMYCVCTTPTSSITRQIWTILNFKGLFYPGFSTHSCSPIMVREYTTVFSRLLRVKFHARRCNEWSLRGEKPEHLSKYLGVSCRRWGSNIPPPSLK